MAATDDLPFPRYAAVSLGNFDNTVVIAMNIDDSVETAAPGLTAELILAVHDAIAARPEFTGAQITRVDAVQTDVTPAT